MSATYDRRHRHALCEIAGYDVVRIPNIVAEPLVMEVSAYVAGSTNYLAALELAKAHRVETEAGCGYGYPTAVYACGCRWIAALVSNSGRVDFRDHERYRA